MNKKEKHILRIAFTAVISIVIILLLLRKCDSSKLAGPVIEPAAHEELTAPKQKPKTDTILRYIKTTKVQIDTLIVVDTIVVIKKQIDTVFHTHTLQSTPSEIEALGFSNLNEDKTSLATDTPLALNKLSKIKQYHFAIKLNLLYLPLTITNIGIEIPINNRFTIGAEWMGTWWWNANKYKGMHIAAGVIETKYWFKEQIKHQKLAGFYVGINAGGGIYDILWNAKGHKGIFYTAGLTTGFVHSITQNLNMEYSIGLGYVYASYEYFTSTIPNQYLWLYDANYKYLGLTRAQIALTWSF